ncbi:Ras family protein (macronuclear) [Tetrahymena thermophila SB210]|uniref:Ras family protein n=1 Tax=Tetrahymena thermophila (strain SB210) TaxID=312017 RepID=I7M3A5_TETTS|nr:Ras family protein [Tetrahymena thermophila SB210]EAS02774.1 Ras family protein [Tetrahymena thermophila SB210]|eukprot:XP_001023019.1 Ras family protein [Tetrahymena thermophila SB210]
MDNKQESKQIDFDIIILDEVGALANDLIVLFSKKQMNSSDRTFKRTIPVAQHDAKIILNLKNRKMFNLNNQSEREEYFLCDGVIICLDLSSMTSIEPLERQIKILKNYNSQDVSAIVVAYSKNNQDSKFNFQDIQNYCNNLKVQFININPETKLDISQIFIDLFASSKVFTQIQNGDYTKKLKTKKTKKFDVKNLIKRITTTFIFYLIIYFFFPDMFSKKEDQQQKSS